MKRLVARWLAGPGPAYYASPGPGELSRADKVAISTVGMMLLAAVLAMLLLFIGPHWGASPTAPAAVPATTGVPVTTPPPPPVTVPTPVDAERVTL